MANWLEHKLHTQVSVGMHLTFLDIGNICWFACHKIPCSVNVTNKKNDFSKYSALKQKTSQKVFRILEVTLVSCPWLQREQVSQMDEQKQNLYDL